MKCKGQYYTFGIKIRTIDCPYIYSSKITGSGTVIILLLLFMVPFSLNLLT